MPSLESRLVREVQALFLAPVVLRDEGTWASLRAEAPEARTFVRVYVRTGAVELRVFDSDGSVREAFLPAVREASARTIAYRTVELLRVRHEAPRREIRGEPIATPANVARPLGRAVFSAGVGMAYFGEFYPSIRLAFAFWGARVFAWVDGGLSLRRFTLSAAEGDSHGRAGSVQAGAGVVLHRSARLRLGLGASLGAVVVGLEGEGVEPLVGVRVRTGRFLGGGALLMDVSLGRGASLGLWTRVAGFAPIAVDFAGRRVDRLGPFLFDVGLRFGWGFTP